MAYQEWGTLLDIHMIDNPPDNGEVKSGYRKSCNTLIWVDMVEAIKSGIEFFQSMNGVILSPGNADGVIPSTYFLKITHLDFKFNTSMCVFFNHHLLLIDE